MRRLVFTLGLGMKACHSGTVYELSLSPGEGESHFHPVIASRDLSRRGNDTTTELNGHVERAQRTHTEEFYEVTDTSCEIAELDQALVEWERVYNTVRPHQALGYLTPKEFLRLHQQNKRKEEVSLII